MEEAALKGTVSAQVRVAECYERGTGVPRNGVKAVLWYIVAAGNRHVIEGTVPYW